MFKWCRWRIDSCNEAPCDKSVQFETRNSPTEQR